MVYCFLTVQRIKHMPGGKQTIMTCAELSLTFVTKFFSLCVFCAVKHHNNAPTSLTRNFIGLLHTKEYNIKKKRVNAKNANCLVEN